MAWDAQFSDGFDMYGPAGAVQSSISTSGGGGVSGTISRLLGKWTSFVYLGPAVQHSAVLTTRASLVATGAALEIRLTADTNGGTGQLALAYLSKTLAANYARVIFARHVMGAADGNADNYRGWSWVDGTTVQASVVMNSLGRWEVWRGNPRTGTLLGTSAASVSDGADHCIEGDITFDATTGIVRLWQDGQLILDLSGLNTAPSANEYFNVQRAFAGHYRSDASAYDLKLTWDHQVDLFYSAGGGGDTALLKNPVIETQGPDGDHVSDFDFGAGVIGEAWRTVTTTHAPGANRLVLRRVYVPHACDLYSVTIVPSATSLTAKFKAVAYADDDGAPTGAPIHEGSEVVACTADVELDLPVASPSSPPALTPGTYVWVGYITDTSISIQRHDATTVGVSAANTYASGAPTSPVVTQGQPSWMIWGNVVGITDNYPQVDETPPVGDRSYNWSATVGHKDVFEFPPLVSTPTTIFFLGLWASLRRTDGGARTVNLIHEVGAVTDPGDAPSQTPATNYGWLGTYFTVDPDTLAAFNASGLNASFSGYEIDS